MYGAANCSISGTAGEPLGSPCYKGRKLQPPCLPSGIAVLCPVQSKIKLVRLSPVVGNCLPEGQYVAKGVITSKTFSALKVHLSKPFVPAIGKEI